MNRRIFVASATAVVASTRSGSALTLRESLRDRLNTRAEATNYQATTRYGDLLHFLSALDMRGAPIYHQSLARTREGRKVPFVVASRPRITTPAEARKLDRPIVLVVASLHGNDVDGKEAILAILRDLCVAPGKTLLDDLVFIIVPMADPDGSERYAAERENAPMQNGPARVGIATTDQGLDLDDDFIKLETPEARGLVALINEWQPDAFINLATSGGSYTDFSITHAPALHPAALFGGPFARDRVLPAVSKELHDKFGLETFVAGHFGRDRVLPQPPSPVDVFNYGWFAPDFRPRHATNYMGVRGMVAVTGNSYAHDSFERRVFSSRAFAESVLGYCSDNDVDVLTNTRVVDHWIGGDVPIRAAYPSKAPVETVAWENLALASDGDPEPGLPPGYARSGTFTSAPMPVFDRYVVTESANRVKGYLVPHDYVARVEELLGRHGILTSVTVEPQNLMVQQFVVGEIRTIAPPLEGHATIAVSGTWRAPFPYVTQFGALVVSCLQPLGPLACVLLEPESPDSVFTWNAFESELKAGYLAPVFRIV